MTSEQIEILVNGICSKKPAAPQGPLPAYAETPGDPVRGAAVFAASCASCHGNGGEGGKAGSVMGSLMAAPSICKPLSMSYNRDLQ